MNFGHAHKTRFWYLLEVFSKFSEEHSGHFYRGVPPFAGPYVTTASKSAFLLPFSHKLSTKGLSPSVTMSKSLLASVARLRNEYSCIFVIKGKINPEKNKTMLRYKVKM